MRSQRIFQVLLHLFKSPWSECSTTFDVGYRDKHRRCLDGVIGELGCSGKNIYTEICYNGRCPSWSDWTKCSKSCGNGVRSRYKDDEKEEVEICNPSACVENTNICDLAKHNTLNEEEETIALNGTGELDIICVSEKNETRGYMSAHVQQNISDYEGRLYSRTWNKVWLTHESNSTYVMDLSGYYLKF